MTHIKMYMTQNKYSQKSDMSRDSEIINKHTI